MQVLFVLAFFVTGRYFFTFFLDKKSNKKVKEKRMLRLFSGPTHRDSGFLKIVFGIVVVVQDPATFYAKHRKALLFRLVSLYCCLVFSIAKKRRWGSLIVIDYGCSISETIGLPASKK